MSYELVFDDNAVRFLEKLDDHRKERIYKKIASAKENPHHFFERLKGHDVYKLVVGDYRVVADIDDDIERIEVLLVGHRRNVYK